MSGRGRKGHLRRVILAISERPTVLVRDEHVVGSTAASMNQPLVVGQAGPSGHQRELKCQDCLRQNRWHRLHK